MSGRLYITGWIVFQASTDAGQKSSISDCCIATESQSYTQTQTQHRKRWEHFSMKTTQDDILLQLFPSFVSALHWFYSNNHFVNLSWQITCKWNTESLVSHFLKSAIWKDSSTISSQRKRAINKRGCVGSFGAVKMYQFNLIPLVGLRFVSVQLISQPRSQFRSRLSEHCAAHSHGFDMIPVQITLTCHRGSRGADQLAGLGQP